MREIAKAKRDFSDWIDQSPLDPETMLLAQKCEFDVGMLSLNESPPLGLRTRAYERLRELERRLAA